MWQLPNCTQLVIRRLARGHLDNIFVRVGNFFVLRCKCDLLTQGFSSGNSLCLFNTYLDLQRSVAKVKGQTCVTLSLQEFFSLVSVGIAPSLPNHIGETLRFRKITMILTHEIILAWPPTLNQTKLSVAHNCCVRVCESLEADGSVTEGQKKSTQSWPTLLSLRIRKNRTADVDTNSQSCDFTDWMCECVLDSEDWKKY